MDIDIDLRPDFKPEKHFKITPACTVEKGELKRHNVGVYFQNIPRDAITGLAAIPYKHAEECGYIKIDLLPLNLLSYFDSKNEIKRLLKRTPNWKLLENRETVERLFHLANSYELVKAVKPTSVNALADVLALIRPNKKGLLNKYLKDPEATRAELYIKRDPSDLRKAHAVAYALNVVLQLHLVEADIKI